MALMLSLRSGQFFRGSLPSEPMRLETMQANGPASWILGLVETRSKRFRKVTLTSDGLNRRSTPSMTGPRQVRELRVGCGRGS